MLRGLSNGWAGSPNRLGPSSGIGWNVFNNVSIVLLKHLRKIIYIIAGV